MKAGLLLGLFCAGLGVLGYALTSAPGQPGVSAPAFYEDFSYVPAAEEAGRDLLDKFGLAQGWIMLSNALIRGNQTEMAVHSLSSGLQKVPANADLWAQMGVALVAHAEGEVVPAARLAFNRARLLDPENLAPAYFLGLAYFEAGDAVKALEHWTPVMASAPPEEGWAQKLRSQMAVARRMVDEKQG